MRTYKLGDQISINLAPNEAIPTGINMVATFFNENNMAVYSVGTSEGTISKINDTLYNITISPTKCMELGLGIYRLEVGLYNASHSYVNISTNDVRFTIVESVTGKEILG